MSTLNAHATALEIPLVPIGTDRRYETDRRLVWNEEKRANEVQEFVVTRRKL
jgi:hypothetical protein